MAITRRVHPGHRETEHDPLVSIKDRLAELAGLGEDWDSYGGHPPAPKAVAEAARFVEEVLAVHWATARGRALPASISPLPSGGIELEWSVPDGLLAIDVGAGGQWGFLRKTDRGNGVQFDEGDDVARDSLFPLLAEVLLAQPPRSS